MGESLRATGEVIAALTASYNRLMLVAHDVYRTDEKKLSWSRVGVWGGEDTQPFATVGGSVALDNNREASITLNVTVEGPDLLVSGEIEVEEDPPDHVRDLLVLPPVRTETAEACIAVIRAYTDQLATAAPDLIAQARALPPL